MSDFLTEKLIAGKIKTDIVPLLADAYHKGMPLKYKATPTAVKTGTGNGTCTALAAGPEVKAGAWVFTLTAALVGKLEDPDGNVVANNIALNDGAATVLKIAGLGFTITDGATPFVATDKFTITVAAGKYEYTEDLTILDALYSGDAKTLSSDGYGAVIVGGEVFVAGLVDDTGDALTITEDEIAAMRGRGFFAKRK